MKLRTLLFFVFAGVAVCNAQVNLDINDCPSPGLELNVTEYFNGVLNLDDSVDIGAPGANGNYDISSISSFVGESSIVEYIDPSTTDWSVHHPDANVSLLSDIETDSASGDTFVIQYEYYIVNDQGCTEAGISFLVDTGYILSQNPSGTLIEAHLAFSPGGNHLNTDYQMGYNGMDTSYWEVTVGALYHYEQSIREINVDGYGQLNTPDGIFDVLRVQITTFSQNYTEVNGNIVENESDTMHSYEFWTNSVGEPLAIVEVSSSWTTVYKVNYTKVMKAGTGYTSNISQLQALKYSIYPNPATDVLNIDLKPNKDISYDIFNILGDKVMNLEAFHSEMSIDVSSLQNGVYFLNISNKGDIVRTEKIIINR